MRALTRPKLLVWAGVSLAIGITAIGIALYSGAPVAGPVRAGCGSRLQDLGRQQTGAEVMSASPLVVAVLAAALGLGELGERPDDSEWKQRQIDMACVIIRWWRHLAAVWYL